MQFGMIEYAPMKRILSPACFLLLLAGCQAYPAGGAIADIPGFAFEEDVSEMGESSLGARPAELFNDPKPLKKERAAFQRALAAFGRNTGGKRALYEKNIDAIGANGILDGIQTLWPTCHSEAHDLGKIIFARTKDVGLGLSICADGCYSGCMHGVLMEAFTRLSNPSDPEAHVDPEKLVQMMNDICYKTDSMQSSYSEGDCAHGIGHALMVLADYDIPTSMEYCDSFDSTAMDYYCATGAYMEYVNTHDPADAKEKSLLYPCDVDPYPAACARYKMVHVVRRHYQTKGKLSELVAVCENLKGHYRLGCFHGLGNGHLSPLVGGEMKLADVCLHGTAQDQTACIDGAMERIGKYHPQKAKEICAGMTGKLQETCLMSAERKMYNMEKDFSLYLNP